MVSVKTKKLIQKASFRWMFKLDFPQVIEIEKQSFTRPWTECDFKNILRKSKAVTHVFELEEKILGYSAVVYHKNACDIIKLAVHEDYRRRGIASKIISNIRDKAFSVKGRNVITSIIPEDNLEAQLFLKESGFKATKIIKDHFKIVHDDHQNIDGYLFEYKR